MDLLRLPMNLMAGRATRILRAAFTALPLFATQAGLAQQLATGESHVVALDTQGRVFTWGADDRGQLGVGKPLFVKTPEPIAGLPPIRAISARNGLIFALDHYGNVWQWGDFEVAPRANSDVAKPGRILKLTGVRSVAAGPYGAVVVKANGEAWGLGIGFGEFSAQTESFIPKRLPFFDGAIHVSADFNEALAVLADGSVLHLGGDYDDGTVVPADEPPRRISGLPSMTSAYLDGSGRGYAGLDQAGQIWIWGCFTHYLCNPAPRRLRLPSKAVAMSRKSSVLHVSLSNGEVWSVDAYEALSVGQEPAFSRVHAFERSVGTVTGTSMMYSLRADGLVEAIGSNGSAQLGTGQIGEAMSTPQRVARATDAVAIAAGGSTGYALTRDGVVLGWGSDARGTISGVANSLHTVPRTVSFPAGTRIVRVATGAASSFAVTANGALYGWGGNRYSTLALPHIDAARTPTLLPLQEVVDIDSGSASTVAIRTDGSAWRAATPINGLGSGRFERVTGVVDARRVFVSHKGEDFTHDAAFVLDSSGVLWGFGYDVWGRGYLGSLGGLDFDYHPPAPIRGLPRPVVDFSIHHTFAIAALDDGSVWTWGSVRERFDYGERVSTPRQVPGLSGVVRVSAGECHGLALKSDGTAWTWGCNSNGQLANGSRTPSSAPNKVSGLESITAVQGGTGRSLFVRSGGLVFAAGGSPYQSRGGPSGDGTLVSREVPVLVVREDGLGNPDRDDWYLDLDPGRANNRPAFTDRTALTNTVGVVDVGGTNSSDSVTLSASITPKSSDLGRSLGIYVLARVSPEFLKSVGAIPSPGSAADAVVKKAKAEGSQVLVNLTPAGWTTVTGQLVAVSTSVLNGASAATQLLNSVRVSSGSFCIGYGDSATSMLSAGTLGEILSLQGATSTASGLPCLVPGVYVSGPSASRMGTPVTFTASVVGIHPTGSAFFTDWAHRLSEPVALSQRNPAVATATFSTSRLSAGLHSVGAEYTGDSQNAAASVATPLLHQVLAQAGSITELSGPVSSNWGDTVTFSLRVAGSNPSGSVRLRKDGVSLGEGAGLVEGMATVQVSNLPLGVHGISALYSGDALNAAGTSNVVTHSVLGALTTEATLQTSPNPSASTEYVALVASVAGTNPTGDVVFKNGVRTVATATVIQGRAIATVNGLAPGSYVFVAEYRGDTANHPATSNQVVHVILGPGTGGTPAAFSFGPRDNVAPGSVVTSNSVTISGVTGPAPIMVMGGAYSIGCREPFGATSGIIRAGETVCVRHVAASELGAAAATTLTVGGVSATFVSTTYSLATRDRAGSLVDHYYRSILGREADANGRLYWQAEALRALAVGGRVSEAFYAMAMGFFSSGEYVGLRRADAAYVADLYRTFFFRAPDVQGQEFWSDQLAKGLPRPALLARFLFSPEFELRMNELFGSVPVRAEIDLLFDLYRGFLARVPDSDGLGYWLSQLRAAQCGRTEGVGAVVDAMSRMFLSGDEYRVRGRSDGDFISDLYNAFLRRGPDLSGVLFWVDVLSRSGPQSRDDIRRQFLRSPEFVHRLGVVVAQGCVG